MQAPGDGDADGDGQQDEQNLDTDYDEGVTAEDQDDAAQDQAGAHEPDTPPAGDPRSSSEHATDSKRASQPSPVRPVQEGRDEQSDKPQWPEFQHALHQ